MPSVERSLKTPEQQLLRNKERRARKKRLISCPGQTHNVFTHFPKCNSCDYCVTYKNQRDYKIANNTKALTEADIPAPTKFGDAVIADHKIIGPAHESGDGDQVCLLLVDRFTRWLCAYPAKTKEKMGNG